MCPQPFHNLLRPFAPSAPNSQPQDGGLPLLLPSLRAGAERSPEAELEREPKPVTRLPAAQRNHVARVVQLVAAGLAAIENEQHETAGLLKDPKRLDPRVLSGNSETRWDLRSGARIAESVDTHIMRPLNDLEKQITAQLGGGKGAQDSALDLIREVKQAITPGLEELRGNGRHRPLAISDDLNRASGATLAALQDFFDAEFAPRASFAQGRAKFDPRVPMTISDSEVSALKRLGWIDGDATKELINQRAKIISDALYENGPNCGVMTSALSRAEQKHVQRMVQLAALTLGMIEAEHHSMPTAKLTPSLRSAAPDARWNLSSGEEVSGTVTRHVLEPLKQLEASIQQRVGANARAVDPAIELVRSVRELVGKHTRALSMESKSKSLSECYELRGMTEGVVRLMARSGEIGAMERVQREGPIFIDRREIANLATAGWIDAQTEPQKINTRATNIAVALSGCLYLLYHSNKPGGAGLPGGGSEFAPGFQPREIMPGRSPE